MIDHLKRRIRHAREHAIRQRSLRRLHNRDALRARVIEKAREWDALRNESYHIRNRRPLPWDMFGEHEAYYSRQPDACTRENLQVIEYHIKKLRKELQAYGPLDARLGR